MPRLRTPIFLACLALGCPQASKQESEPSAASPESDPNMLPDRDPALAKRLVEEEGALLLDVRTLPEYELGHAEGAMRIPHDELEERLAEVVDAQGGDKDKPIVVYCRSGKRSGIAKEILVKAGFKKVTNLGGFDDWPGN